VLPDESGLDDAPKYEPVFGVRTHDRLGYYHALWRARRHRYSASAIVAAYDDHVEDVLVNVLYARGLLALGGVSPSGPTACASGRSSARGTRGGPVLGPRRQR
jgi:hypothetical protein